MRTARRPTCIYWVAILATAATCAPVLGQTPKPAKSPDDQAFQREVVPFLTKHCLDCHSGKEPEGEVSLDVFKDPAAIAADQKTWQRVIEMLRSGAMPPEDAEQPPMPARSLMAAGVPVAVATDFNPGSAPSYHLPFAMTLACTLQRMTPAEVLKGATIIAARAIGAETECGSLEPGKSADFAIMDAPDVNLWLYHLQGNACVRTVVRGQTVWG